MPLNSYPQSQGLNPAAFGTAPNPHPNQNFAAFGNTPGAGFFNQTNNMNNSNTNDPESSRMEDVGGADGLEGVNFQER